MTYSEKMLQALQNEDLAEAQLSLEEALKKAQIAKEILKVKGSVKL